MSNTTPSSTEAQSTSNPQNPGTASPQAKGGEKKQKKSAIVFRGGESRDGRMYMAEVARVLQDEPRLNQNMRDLLASVGAAKTAWAKCDAAAAEVAVLQQHRAEAQEALVMGVRSLRLVVRAISLEMTQALLHEGVDVSVLNTPINPRFISTAGAWARLVREHSTVAYVTAEARQVQGLVLKADAAAQKLERARTELRVLREQLSALWQKAYGDYSVLRTDVRSRKEFANLRYLFERKLPGKPDAPPAPDALKVAGTKT